MARYGKKAATKVAKALHERKRGTLKMGRSGKTVKSRKQAIAIGLAEARRAGGKVPAKKSAKAAAGKKRPATKKSAAGKATASRTRKRVGGRTAAPRATRPSARKKK